MECPDNYWVMSTHHIRTTLRRLAYIEHRKTVGRLSYQMFCCIWIGRIGTPVSIINPSNSQTE